MEMSGDMCHGHNREVLMASRKRSEVLLNSYNARDRLPQVGNAHSATVEKPSKV